MGNTSEKGQTHRLEDMDTQFVSLVRAGANRQKKFMIVKRDNHAPPVDDEENTPQTDINSKSPTASSAGDDSDSNASAAAQDADFLSMLDEACTNIDGRLIDIQLDAAIEAFKTAPSAKEAVETQKSVESGTRSEAHSNNEQAEELSKQLQAERKERARLKEELRKQQAKNAALRTSIGKSSALSYGEVDGSDLESGGETASLWGGDLAEEATKE